MTGERALFLRCYRALLQRAAQARRLPAISALQDNARKEVKCTLGFTSQRGIVDGAGKYTNR